MLHRTIAIEGRSPHRPMLGQMRQPPSSRLPGVPVPSAVLATTAQQLVVHHGPLALAAGEARSREDDTCMHSRSSHAAETSGSLAAEPSRSDLPLLLQGWLLAMATVSGLMRTVGRCHQLPLASCSHSLARWPIYMYVRHILLRLPRHFPAFSLLLVGLQAAATGIPSHVPLALTFPS